MAGKRSYAAGRFALGIDGVYAGFVKKCSGGNIKGEVATHKLGTAFYAKKNLATISYEPLTVEISAGMGQPMWEWIKASMDRGFVQKNLSLQACNFDHKVESVRELNDCYIEEISLPAFDGSSKDAAYLTCKIAAETIVNAPGGGEQIKGDENMLSKQFLCSNFRVSIGDLPCDRVAKVGAIKWTQKVVKDEVGAFRSPKKEPAALEIGDIELDISQADIGPWEKWFKSFLIDGNCTDADELNGSITLLSPDLKKELLTIELLHLGITELSPADVEASKEEIARFKVKMYVEEIRISNYAK